LRAIGSHDRYGLEQACRQLYLGILGHSLGRADCPGDNAIAPQSFHVAAISAETIDISAGKGWALGCPVIPAAHANVTIVFIRVLARGADSWDADERGPAHSGRDQHGAGAVKTVLACRKNERQR